jgi:hypothetical protein
LIVGFLFHEGCRKKWDADNQCPILHFTNLQQNGPTSLDVQDVFITISAGVVHAIPCRELRALIIVIGDEDMGDPPRRKT